MTIQKTTTDLSTLKINYLTKEMYENALENDEINENELYITPGSGSIESTDIPTADKVAEFDSTAHMNSTDMTSSEVEDFVDELDVSGINAVDYIVEEGTSGYWSYRKWNSGIGECWGSFPFTSVSSAGTIGGFNYATITSTPNFPFTFSAVPDVTTGRFYWGSGIGICNVGGASRTKVTSLWIMSTNVGDKSGVYSLHAIGRWK